MEGSRIPTPIKQLGLRLIERGRAVALPGAGSAAIVLAALALDESGAGFLAGRPAAARLPQRSGGIILVADSGQVPRPTTVGPPVVLFSPSTHSSLTTTPDPSAPSVSPSPNTLQKPVNRAAVPAKPPTPAPTHPPTAAPVHPAAVPAPARPLIPPAALPVKLGSPPEARAALPLDTDLQPLDGAPAAPAPGAKPPQ